MSTHISQSAMVFAALCMLVFAGIWLSTPTMTAISSAAPPDTAPAAVAAPDAPMPTRYRLVVVLSSGSKLAPTTQSLTPDAVGLHSTRLADFAETKHVSLRPMFPIHHVRPQRMAPANLLLEVPATRPIEPGSRVDEAVAKIRAQAERFYLVDAPQERLAALAEELRTIDGVATAYLEPVGSPPVAPRPAAPPGHAPPLQTPDFSKNQIYLQPAPAGIDAISAWKYPGGAGRGVQIIDLEWAWLTSHEDLLPRGIGFLGGVPECDLNHGTSVLGELSAANDNRGVTGICPDATVNTFSFDVQDEGTIWLAADMLRPGDIMILEIHLPGPNAGFKSNKYQHGYIPVEWFQGYLQAIQYATAMGIIVVEAAGNGNEYLDADIYNKPAPSFDKSWQNPFAARPGAPDSGAILVGAGAPPPGTHGHNLGPDRSRLSFSNFGSRVDAQGWGDEVTTTGGDQDGPGDLQGGYDPTQWYTDHFSGTSSATPMVAGSIACVQGALRARHVQPLTPAEARKLLRNTGSSQQQEAGSMPGAPLKRIGNRPDLSALISAALKLRGL